MPTPRRGARRRRNQAADDTDEENYNCITTDEKVKVDEGVEVAAAELYPLKSKCNLKHRSSDRSCCSRICCAIFVLVQCSFYVLVILGLGFSILQSATQMEEMGYFEEASGLKIQSLEQRITELDNQLVQYKKKLKAQDNLEILINELDGKLEQHKVKLQLQEDIIQKEVRAEISQVGQNLEKDIKATKDQFSQQVMELNKQVAGFSGHIQNIQGDLAQNVENVVNDFKETLDVVLDDKKYASIELMNQEMAGAVEILNEKIGGTEDLITETIAGINDVLNKIMKSVEKMADTMERVIHDVTEFEKIENLYDIFDEYLFKEGSGAAKKMYAFFKDYK